MNEYVHFYIQKNENLFILFVCIPLIKKKCFYRQSLSKYICLQLFSYNTKEKQLLFALLKLIEAKKK